jgi:hypothetical protein
MRFQHQVVIHLVELVAGEDQGVFEIVLQEMVHTLPYGIGRALVPGLVAHGLFSGKDIHKGRTEKTEMIGVLDMLVQGGRIELRQDKHALDLRIDTVGYRDVNQTILTRNRNCRF